MSMSNLSSVHYITSKYPSLDLKYHPKIFIECIFNKFSLDLLLLIISMFVLDISICWSQLGYD